MVGAFGGHDVVTFGAWSGADIQISGLPSFQQIIQALPRDWSPDLVLVWRPEYGYIPTGIEGAACPVAMLVSDWYLAFSDCLEAAWRVDAIVTGTRGEHVFRAAGFENVFALPMLGYQPGVDTEWPLGDDFRPIDVCCSGNPNWVIHRERERIIGALLELPNGITTYHGPYSDRTEYNRRLSASKIYVNQTVIGEANMKFYEVAAAGACLFVEEDNLDIERYFTPGESVVLYGRTDLADKIIYYLNNPEKRIGIAEQARRAMREYTYKRNFGMIVNELWSFFRSWNREPRPVTELPRATQLEGLVGYALRHNGGDPYAPLGLALGLSESGSQRSMLLLAMAQYVAKTSTIARRSPIESGAHVGAGGANREIWDDEAIVAHFQQAFLQDPSYLPAAYTWARIATAHLGFQHAFPLVDHVRRLLEGGGAIPFSCAEILVLDTDVRFEVERAAWEALERGIDIGSVLRPLLLEDIYLVAADLHLKAQDSARAMSSYTHAVLIRPDGHRARPRLAELQAHLGEDWSAIETLNEHLKLHPLDLRAHDRMVALLEICGDNAGCLAAMTARDKLHHLYSDSFGS